MTNTELLEYLQTIIVKSLREDNLIGEGETSVGQTIDFEDSSGIWHSINIALDVESEAM